MSKKNTKEHWNLTSLEYQKNRIILFNDIEYALEDTPGHTKESELNLLGDIKDKEIIELGCGGAEISITLAKKGAICTGIDMSVEQLKYARNSAEKHGVKIKLIESDIENLATIKDDSFDIAISVFALDWVFNLEAAFREAYRILKNKGIFVFSTQHPIYNLFGAEDLDPKELKISGSYFAKEVTFVEPTGLDLKAHVSKISDFVNGLIKTGFIIDTMLEFPLKEIKEIPSAILFKVIKALK